MNISKGFEKMIGDVIIYETLRCLNFERLNQKLSSQISEERHPLLSSSVPGKEAVFEDVK